MIELQDAADFAADAIAKLRVSRENVGQDLQCDISIQLGVACAIDLAHPPFAEQGDDFVRAKACAGSETHRKWARLYEMRKFQAIGNGKR